MTTRPDVNAGALAWKRYALALEARLGGERP